nr:FAD-dependent oxidoreductase [Vitreoscilla sp. C1]
MPLDTERGYHYMLPQEKNRLSIPISSADRRFIMTPMDTGLRLAGTVEYAGLQAAPNMERARKLLQLANPMLKTTLNAQDATEWMGFRPTIVDSLPVIDRFGSIFLAFGHQHLGLTHAAITAQLMQNLMQAQKPILDLHPYRLNRF